MDLLQSQNSLVNVGDLQNMRENQMFWQLLHGATHGLTFSRDVVWERAAETIPYSQTDFRWLFCSFGPPATSSKPKGRRTVTLRHLPRQSSPRVHAGAHGDKERLVGPLAPLPHRTILVTAQDSFITLSQKGPLGDRGNRKDQSSCRDKKPARTMPERIPQLHQIPEQCPIPKQHQIPEQQQITKQCQIPEQQQITKQCQIPEQQQITKQRQIPEQQQITKQHQIPEQQQIPEQCQIPAQYQIPELRQISEQHQIKQWLWPNAPSLICKAPVNQEDLSRDQDLLKAPYINQSKTALPAHHSHDRPLGGTEQVDTGRYGCSAAYPNIYLSFEKSTQGGRVPRFSRPSVHTNEHSGSNSAVASVTIKCTETPLQPRDCLNPHTSSYVKQTMNSFQQLPFTGIPELQCSAKRKNGISVDSAAQHQKHLQQGFPCGPEKGTELPEAGVVPRVPCEGSYWVKRCVPINCTAEMSPRPPGGSRTEARLPQGRIIGMLWQPPGHKPSLERSLLRYAVEEWMIAWKIKTSWQSITTEGLKKAFGDLHHRVRLEAIATCALRAVNGAREDQDPASTEIDHVLQELQPLLITALDDDHMQIQMAAAVCQCAIGRPSPWAREILHSTLHKGAGADVWLAAQCLAAGGAASLPVIQILISRLFGSEVRREQEQATALLANVSTKTTVVRTLLAKELNCANWRNRVLSCKTIAQLKGPINKDLVNKLTQLMWKDCCSEARQAAAHALGALGRGRELHNQLRVQLEEGPSSLRVEALVLLAELQIMTTRLIPSLLGCLRDDFVAVRKQACLTAAALSTKDEVIVNQLIELIQDDPVWGIKVAAITALGKIGCLTPPLQKILLQAIHCEEEPEVRIAACEAIRILRVDLPELQHLLQQRLLLETHLQVHRHIESLMKSYGFPIDRDENMVLKIKDQVQKLCSKHTITIKVLLLEELHDSQEQQMRFLGHSARPDSPPADMTELLQARYRAELNRSSSVAIISRSTDNTAGIQPPCMNQELSVEEPQPTPVT
ncbi:hypothetical protein SKAU_G00211450 [Synaphobranchus kaupii]|uniref:HEAT repeat-containing protein 4 n=1 Tax=Synaphobranchus kaupii TaxID=118154 RepID=A0A9Q1F9E9_SYNKA|nr:hypothetical protein SKAU_G00211450 [Synaphobranchus kaupii]